MTRLLSAIALALATAAGPALAADGKPEPFTIKGGTPIDCNNSPFGRFLPVGIDQEVLVTRVSGGTPSLYQLSGGPLAPERELLGSVGTSFPPNVTRFATTTADLDGDGDEEYIAASLSPSSGNTLLRVGTYARSPDNGGAMVLVGEFFRNFASTRTLFEIHVAAADLYGRRDGTRQIVVGTRFSSTVTGNNIEVFALDTGPGGVISTPGAANPLPFERRFSTDTGAYAGTDTLRIAAGNPLLEGPEQVMMVTRRQTGGAARLGYTILRPGGGTAFVDFPGSFVEEEVAGTPLARMTVHVADLGNTVGHEVLVGLQTEENGNLTTPQLRVRNYSVQRSADGSTFLGATMAGLNANYNVPGTGSGPFAVATGQVDRRPGDDIIVAFREGSNLRADTLRAVFNAGGLLTGIAPASPAITATAPASDLQGNRIEAAIGDANSDAAGDVYVVYTGLAGITPVTRLRRFSLDAPLSDDAIPPAASFTLRASYDFPSNLPVTSSIDLRVADVDQDSVVARIGAECRRVRDPLVRSVVRIPPYWERLQADAPEGAATIGRTQSTGGSNSQAYATFTSHDVSGYFGAQFGSESIGFKVTAKAKAGGNWQSTRGVETAFEQSTTYSEANSISEGEGLVVEESNVFDCYSFNVERGGQAVASSTVRACEIVRIGENGTNPRTITGVSLEAWDTSRVANQPAQWLPLHPDWANLALFRPVTSQFNPVAGAYANATDGRFDTAVQTFILAPYIDIDLGSVQDISNIRVWHAPSIQRLSRATLTASPNPIGASPTPGERTFSFDPGTDNGIDRWNIWTRDPATNAPMRARYLRIRATGSLTLTLAEVQVFGEVHREPVDFPDAVCDPVPGDGTFFAVVADKVSVPNRWRLVHMRGDLLWSGIPATTSDTRCPAPTYHPGVLTAPIWDTVSFTGSANNSWALSQESTNLIGSNTSIEHSARFGAEIEAELGLVVGAVAGIAYEFATGATQTQSTTMYWGSGLEYAGAMNGFADPTAANCDYRPQPYSYAVTDRSNTGFTHRYTVVDYVVRGLGWSRIGGNPPAANCFPAREDGVFSNSFEPAAP
jgi:hypothetical protein